MPKTKIKTSPIVLLCNQNYLAVWTQDRWRQRVEVQRSQLKFLIYSDSNCTICPKYIKWPVQGKSSRRTDAVKSKPIWCLVISFFVNICKNSKFSCYNTEMKIQESLIHLNSNVFFSFDKVNWLALALPVLMIFLINFIGYEVKVKSYTTLRHLILFHKPTKDFQLNFKF